MKRKPINTTSDNTTAYFLNKIDEAVDSLSKNEDELGKVIAELASRKLSEKERDILNSTFEVYKRGTKSVEQITEN